PDSLAKTILLNATPLETAIASHSMALEKTKLLLEHKADPNRRNSRISSMLVLAIGLDDPNAIELVQVLGEAGFRMTDPELMEKAVSHKNTKIIGLLLKNGANPNISIPDEFNLNQKTNISMLRRVAGTVGDDVEGMECLKLLVESGAQPEEEWMGKGFDGVRGMARDFLIEKFTIPKLVGDSDTISHK
ncbi:MAG TPA: hypothetical protein VK465_03510, partial [Fibrobacteria bacterium]|nr:hypothetical protein [Fibrobacteria bacterium]